MSPSDHHTFLIRQVLEGVLLGTGDLAFLSWSQLGNVLAAVFALSATRALGMGVHGVWLVWLAFTLSRVGLASLRVFVLRRPWEQGVFCDVQEEEGGPPLAEPSPEPDAA